MFAHAGQLTQVRGTFANCSASLCVDLEWLRGVSSLTSLLTLCHLAPLLEKDLAARISLLGVASLDLNPSLAAFLHPCQELWRPLR